MLLQCSLYSRLFNKHWTCMFCSYTKKQAILPHVTDEETEALRSYNQPTVSHQALYQATWLQAKMLQRTLFTGCPAHRNCSIDFCYILPLSCLLIAHLFRKSNHQCHEVRTVELPLTYHRSVPEALLIFSYLITTDYYLLSPIIPTECMGKPWV